MSIFGSKADMDQPLHTNLDFGAGTSTNNVPRCLAAASLAFKDGFLI